VPRSDVAVRTITKRHAPVGLADHLERPVGRDGLRRPFSIGIKRNATRSDASPYMVVLCERFQKPPYRSALSSS
jgi:hypothetical protein